jgi:pyruvate dehydrogenase E1 component alpha subunit
VEPAITWIEMTSSEATFQAVGTLPTSEPTSAVPFRILSSDGSLPSEYVLPLEVDCILSAYRWMLLSRQLDERAIKMQRQGRLGTFAPCLGQEAATLGAAAAIDPARDWFVPQYRELVAMVRQGYPLERVLRYFMGDLAGARIPDGVNVLPIQIALAAQLPQAVGLAWGLRLQGDDGVVLVSVGDGASSEGDFHEACNFAGVLRAPVVILLQNNQWAISTPRTIQTAAAAFADRAKGYGFPGVLVDGNDFFAMYETVRDAVARARSGMGPTLVEASTFRLFGHNTADDYRRYSDPDELERRREDDPIDRLRSWLFKSRHLSEDQDARFVQEAADQVSAAVALAEATKAPGPEALFNSVYETDFPRLATQRHQWTTGRWYS